MSVYRKKTSVRILSVIFALILILGACQSCTTPSEQQEIQTVAYTDALGRNVKLPKNPLRVAALLGSFADVWTLAGGRLVAAAEDAAEDFGLPMEGIINLGGAHSPSLEALISANPDLVLASASTASNVAMREALEAIGIPVVYFNVDHFGDYLQMLDVCTDLTGRKDLYLQNGVQIEEQIQQVKREFAALNLPESERTVLLLRASSGFVKAKGSSGTILGEMLADMGCVNIADSDTSLLENLSIEGILRQNPNRIFAVTMGNDTEAAIQNLFDLLHNNPAWASLEAVQENRVFVMEKQLFNLKPNARWGLAYETLYETFTK